jgi:ribosomal protein L20A (L18A)
VTANTRKYAEELTYAFFGSKHHLKRCFIKIEEVKTKDETKEKGD